MKTKASRSALFMCALFLMCCGGSGGGAEEGRDSCATHKNRKKVAVVNYGLVMQKCKDGIAAMLELERMKNEYQLELDRSSAELEKLKVEIEKNKDALEASGELEAKTSYYQSRFQEIQDLFALRQTQLKQKEFEETQRILDNIKRVVDKLRETLCYQMIYDSGSSIVSASKEHPDLTRQAIELYNSGDY